MTNDEFKALCNLARKNYGQDSVVYNLTSECLELLAQCDAMREVVDAAKAHANATVEFRLARITERDIAGYYNRLIKALSQLGERSEETP